MPAVTLAWLVGVHDELVAGWVYQGWIYWVGSRGGYTGVLPSHRVRVPLTAKRAPEALVGLEWVVSGSRPQGCVGGSQDHPSGPVGTLRVPPCPGTLECRLLANKARIRSIFSKVSQNRQVSPEYV